MMTANIFISYWYIFIILGILITLVLAFLLVYRPKSRKKIQNPILPMTADEAEKSVMKTLRRKIVEYKEMGNIGIWKSRMYGEDGFLFGYECELDAVRKNLKDQGFYQDGNYYFCSFPYENTLTDKLRRMRDCHYSTYFNEKCDEIMKKSLQAGLKKSQTDVLVLSDYMLEELGVMLRKEYIALKLREVEIRYNIAQLKEEQKQAEIEERKAQKDYERALKDAAKNEEKTRLQLEKQREALDNAASEYEKIELQKKVTALEEKLQEALAMRERALSMAQQTRIGYVYVISNKRSFGEDIYKIGMTRRLDPMDRVRELSNASVPFAFDVHYMIYTDDAPQLEAKLHQHFSNSRINTDNYRKEFFCVPLTEITETLTGLGILRNEKD